MSRAREAMRRSGLFGSRRKEPVRDRGLPPSPNGASSFHIWWSLPDTGLASVSAVLEVLSPPAAERLAFFALQASFWSPAGCEGGAHAVALQSAGMPHEVALGRLHLDHVRALVAQNRGGDGAGVDRRQVENANAVQGAGHQAAPPASARSSKPS